MSINKKGDKFATGSYDGDCIIWNTKSGKKEQKLEGHTDVVYTASFNLPYDDKVGTGSFDQTAKIWNINNGECLSTFKGHSGEIICLEFNKEEPLMITGSMEKLQFYGI